MSGVGRFFIFDCNSTPSFVCSRSWMKLLIKKTDCNCMIINMISNAPIMEQSTGLSTVASAAAI